MSITVDDCLKLPSLREAEVVAGMGGLDKIVSSVTVLEYADYSAITDTFFVGNEIVITAFFSVKDNVKSQCEIIRRLSEVGEAALILYYVGIFVPQADQRLLEVANELNFPLICMPAGRFDFRYSDVLSEVQELIIKDRTRQIEFGNMSVSALIQAILNDEPLRTRSIASFMRIDISSIHVMWVLIETKSGLSDEERQNRNIWRLTKAKTFLRDYNNVIVDAYKDKVIIFVSDFIFGESLQYMAESFVNFLDDPLCILVENTKLETTAQVRSAYMLMQNTLEAAQLIYPSHRILRSHELIFVRECLEFAQRGEETVDQIINLLTPLADHEDSSLIQTLSVFLLDTKNDIAETGKRMFLHQNTIRYRINKIKQRLGYDISKMPEAYNLYLAVALKRLFAGLTKERP